ncbi:Do family serine endopeptidase [Candidatus Pantoea edessiphila]|uniref:Serine endoprotease DegQ n=1 Tax=Candidatus Pantoea edessiphila TaxID=2044610 RepID=A0A2P5SW26_9GAMM|nr:Do family serine endopeptidase [Candidatus Pantoea edessiphila]PPI86538.1 serine endoprotease DegQ [Candidatus Pantoea edessiphila]
MKKKVKMFNLLFLTLCLNFIIVSNLMATLPIQNQSIPSLAPMLEKVLPAIVSIRVEGIGITYSLQGQENPESLKRFVQSIPDNNNRVQPFEGLGSGVIINANKGYVLTNNHVINGANKIFIKLGDNREYSAKLIGSDEQTDIALIKISGAQNLTQVKIAKTENIHVGDFVIAVGNPFGLGQTVTSGIVSALCRSGLNIEGLENFIQTDAAINHGSSGGALINLNGELIGISTAILASNGGSIGIGFAIPSDIAIDLSKQILKYGEVRRGQLGIKGSEISIDMQKTFNLKSHYGVFISEVLDDSAAQKAGIQSGDVITLVNNKPIHNFSELRIKIGLLIPREKIKVTVIRKGKPLTIDINVKENRLQSTSRSIFSILPGAFFINGMTQSGNKGIQIENVNPGTLADQLGLEKDDVIININLKRTRTVKDMIKIINDKPPALAINVIRGNESLYLVLK